jgi:WD40 repeat protein
MSPFFSLAFSPNGKLLAILEPPQLPGARPAVTEPSTSPPSKLRPGRVRVVPLARPNLACELPGYTELMAFSADGNKAAGLYDGDPPSITVLDMTTRERCCLDTAVGSAMALSPDGSKLATWTAPPAGAKAESSTKLGKSLATAQRDLDRTLGKEIELWNVPSGKVRVTLRGHNLAIRAVVFTGDGKSVVTGSEDGTIRFWDPETGDEKCTLKGHEGGVLCMALSSDGSILASGGRDGIVRLWRLDPKDAAAMAQAPPRPGAKPAPANGPVPPPEKGH